MHAALHQCLVVCLPSLAQLVPPPARFSIELAQLNAGMTSANASNGWAKEPWLLFRFTQRPSGAATRGTELVLPIPGASGAELGLSHAERAAFACLSLEQWVVDGRSLGSTASELLQPSCSSRERALRSCLLPCALPPPSTAHAVLTVSKPRHGAPGPATFLSHAHSHPVFKSPKLWEGAQPKCLHLLQGEGTGGQAEAKVSYSDCTLGELTLEARRNQRHSSVLVV